MSYSIASIYSCNYSILSIMSGLEFLCHQSPVDATFFPAGTKNCKDHHRWTHTHTHICKQMLPIMFRQTSSVPPRRHKWGQSSTHSTTNERGSPQITTLLEPGATSDFMSTATRLIYSRSSLSAPTTAQRTHLLTPPPLPHPTQHTPPLLSFCLLDTYTNATSFPFLHCPFLKKKR